MPRPRRALFVAFAGMGATASLVPAVLPSLASGLGIPGAALLGSVPGLFAGLLVGVLFAPVIIRSRSEGFGVRTGAALQAIGLLLLAYAPSPALVIGGAAIAGLGFGLVEASGTALARVLSPEHVTRMLVILTATVAVVAAACPLVVVAAGPPGLVRWVLVVAAVLQLAAVLTMRMPAAPARVLVSERIKLSLGGVLPAAFALFCYVGVESVLAGWSALTVQNRLGTSASVAAVGTSAFWVLMSIGRFVGGRMLRRSPRSGVAVLCCLAAIGLLLLGAAVSASPLIGLLLISISVVLCGPCYALVLGGALGAVPRRLGPSVIASMIACGAAGGTVIPLLAAVAGDRNLWIVGSFAIVGALVLLAGGGWRRPAHPERAIA